MRVRLQRKVEVWIEETYDVEEVTPEVIQDLVDYNKECYSVEPLWETQEDVGPIEIYNENWDLIDERK